MVAKVRLLIIVGIILYASVVFAVNGNLQKGASVKLLNHKLDPPVRWILMVFEGEDYGSLTINGIFALDKMRLIAYGSISVPEGDVRSLLLLSKDGGRSWIETMRPESASSVETVAFWKDGLTGISIVTWTLGDLGQSTVFYTADGGRTWREKGTLPKVRNIYCAPVEAYSTGKDSFLVDLSCHGEDDPKEVTLMTKDGCKSWRPVKKKTSIGSNYDSLRGCFWSLQRTACLSINDHEEGIEIISKDQSGAKRVSYINKEVLIKGSRYSIGGRK